jgi:F-type H+-transporting ATPase subunit gamma
MSRRREVELHRRRLGEIREIMNSMKSLAYMETRKLARFLDAQRAVVDSIRAVAADFLEFFPDTLPAAPGNGPSACLLVGSERGFCGDFNEALLRRLASAGGNAAEAGPALIAVGRKLHGLLQHDPRLAATVEGADVVEDVEEVLTRTVGVLTSQHLARGRASLDVVYHGADAGGGIVAERLWPPFQSGPSPATRFSHPPLLNVPPRDFLLALADHYLFAALHGILYGSLMAENHRRVRHLDGATRHLDAKTADLSRRASMLRQEEIIEEIEVILLSAESLVGPDGAAAR